MANTQLLCFLLLMVAIYGQLLPSSQFKVLPEEGQIRGVFEVSTTPHPYAFNASIARIMCEHLGATLATKAQVEEAHAYGLQTCRYGWVQELQAVIPRIEPQQSCGKGATGVLLWNKGAEAPFDAFCFRATDLETRTGPTGEESSSSWRPFSTMRLLLPGDLLLPTSVFSSTAAPVFFSTTAPAREMQHVSVQVLLPTFLAVLGVAVLLLVGILILRHYRIKRFRICNGDHGKDEKPASEKDSEGCLSEADGNSNDIGLTVVPKMQPDSP
ncbi:lymphatic vessel endothelial hyaluronic acid receptor 1 [Arapaima gigas]